jgi:hypothetical protein
MGTVASIVSGNDGSDERRARGESCVHPLNIFRNLHGASFPDGFSKARGQTSLSESSRRNLRRRHGL